ncbi:anti-sigma factor family protein, partial [Armatimonas sp.]|uniref:anti-sigma factor family protein n=1 Tax=Armatimonas sp. TaxID=1872638 RepID=UPI0037505ABF
MPQPRSSVRECRNSLQEELKAYLDGELPPLRRAAVERHLGTCLACQAELKSLRQLSVQLSEALPTAAPLPDALRARILRSLPDAPTPRPVLFPFWRRPGPLAAFGGALAVGCAFWLWVRVPESGKPMTATASSATRATMTDEAKSVAVPPASVALRANENEAQKAPAFAAVHESASSLKASLPVSVSPGVFREQASGAGRVRLSSPAAPSPVLSDGDPEGAGKKDK